MTSPSELIRFHVAEHKKYRALANIGDGLGAETPGTGLDGEPVQNALHPISLSRMLSESFDSEAHFWPGQIPGLDCRIPRLSKHVLGQLREAGHGPEMTAVVLDWDLKDFRPLASVPRGPDGKKLPWSNLNADQTSMVRTAVQDAMTVLESYGLAPNVVYTSPAGLRFIVGLAFGIPAGAAFEAYHARVLGIYQLAGLDCDESCKDWTRLYRVPRMKLADGTATGDADWFLCSERWTDVHIPEMDKVEVGPETPTVRVERSIEGMPGHEDARLLVEFIPEGKKQWAPTEACKRARMVLKGRDSFPYCFEAATPSGGTRHTTLVQTVGDVCGALYGLPGMSMEFIFGLLLPMAERLGQDEPWPAKVWEMTTTFWAREESKARTQTAITEQVREAVKERALTARETFVAGLRTWMGDSIRGLDDAQVIETFMAQKLAILIDRKAKEFRIIRADGYYDRTAYALANLRRRIHECGMDWLVPTTVDVVKKDALVTVDLDDDRILAQFSRTYSREICKLHIRGNSVLLDGNEATFVHVPFRLREDIDPRFDKRVDTWLRAMVEPDQFDTFQRAIGYMLAIYDGPTAALSVCGPKATGKKMLAHGLSECFLPWGTPVPGVELTTKHNDSMLRNPIIWIDEGVDQGSSGANFADVFRRVVAGGSLQIEPKGLAKIEISGVHRILFTANNFEAIRSIGGKKARTDNDWQALSERFIQFTLSERAAQYLREIGGLNGTRGWIEGDAGQPSEFIVARHFMWIYHEVLDRNANGQLVRLGARLLIEGAASQEITHDMEADAGLVPEVAAAINDMLTTHGGPRALNPVRIKGDQVLVLSTPVVRFMQEKSPNVKATDIRDALNSMSHENRLRTVDGLTARWRTVDAKKLMRILEYHGGVCLPLAEAAGFDVAATAERLAQED